MFPFIILLFLSIIPLFCRKTHRDYFLYVLILYMTLLCGLRGKTTGNDTINYYYFALSNETDTRFGYFYEYLRDFCSILGDNNPHLFIFSLSVLTFIPLLYIVKKASVNPSVSIFIYIVATSIFYLEAFNIARQSLSIIYPLFGVYYFSNKNYIKSALFFSLSVVFHKIAIILIPFLLLDRVKFSYRVVILSLVLSALIGFSTDLSFLFNILSKISDSGTLLSSFGSYGDKDIFSGWNYVGKLSHILPLSLLTILCYNDKTRETLYYKLLIVGAIGVNLLVSMRYCERLVSMFTIMQIIAVPHALIYNNRKKKYLLILLLVLILIYHIYYLYSIYNRNFIEDILPYRSCF